MYEKRAISLVAARQVVAAVLAAIGPGDKPVAIAVADDTGELVYTERMDGATANDLYQAERKAYTAAFMARDTAGYREQLLHDGRTLADWSDSMLTTLTGGLTIGARRQVFGGIGVHGNGAERDEALARAGLAAAQGVSGNDPLGGRGEGVRRVGPSDEMGGVR